MKKIILLLLFCGFTLVGFAQSFSKSGDSLLVVSQTIQAKDTFTLKELNLKISNLDNAIKVREESVVILQKNIADLKKERTAVQAIKAEAVRLKIKLLNK